WLAYTGASGTNSWNYYDVGLALYRMYYRTGKTIYLTQARQFTDYWWQWGIDHGYEIPVPRASGVVSQFLRAADGHPERFPGLYFMVNYWITQSLWDAPGTAGVDTREAGYAHWGAALGARLDPDSSNHTQYCTWLTTIGADWNSSLITDGSGNGY